MLDLALSHLRERRERTYSAPLATRALLQGADGASTARRCAISRGSGTAARISGTRPRASRRDIALAHRDGPARRRGLRGRADRPPRAGALRRRIAGECPGLRPSADARARASRLAGPVAFARPALPRARHRQGRAGRPLPGAQEHPHRPRHRHADHARDCCRSRIALGIMAGYFRAGSTTSIQYLYTMLNSIPGVLLIAACVLMVQVVHRPQRRPVRDRRRARRLPPAPAVRDPRAHRLGRPRRLLRGETLKLRELEYVQAAHAFGVSRLRASWRATSCPTWRTSC